MTQINACTSYTIEDGIAVITSDNPPVNALSHAVRDGLTTALDCGPCRRYRAGDRHQLRGPDLFRRRRYHRIRQAHAIPGSGRGDRRARASRSPSSPSIFGTALGGGLEVALGCHYRVAVATRAARPAGGQARHPARRRRHTAPAPPDRRPKKPLVDDRLRHAGIAPESRFGRRADRRHRGRIRSPAPSPSPGRSSRAAASSPGRATARTKSPRRASNPAAFRGCRQSRTQKTRRRPSPCRLRRFRPQRLHPGLRRRHRRRARAVREAGDRRPEPGATAHLFQRARGRDRCRTRPPASNPPASPAPSSSAAAPWAAVSR